MGRIPTKVRRLELVPLHCRRFAEESYASLFAPEYQTGREISSDTDFTTWLVEACAYTERCKLAASCRSLLAGDRSTAAPRDRLQAGSYIAHPGVNRRRASERPDLISTAQSSTREITPSKNCRLRV